MKAGIIGTTLLTIVAGAATADVPKSAPSSEANSFTPSEPTMCFRLVGKFDEGLPIGLATDLCGGTTSAMATLSCYVEAFSSTDSGGLGLNRGSAIELCRPAGAPARR